VPAPNTCFYISCTCGSLVTHGSATSKKGAKKDAATNMLAYLKNMARSMVPELANTGINSVAVTPKKLYTKKKKSKSLVKMVSSLYYLFYISISNIFVRLFDCHTSFFFYFIA